MLYRDQLQDGTMTDWTEVSLCDMRRWWHMVWNPGRREKKALFDLTVALLNEAINAPALDLIQVSVPYITLLSFVSSLPRLESVTATQFLLIISYGSTSNKDPYPMFTSAIHPL